MTRSYLNTVLRILLLPLIVFSVHAVAIGFFDVYRYWHSFDIPMHFLGGASIAYAAHLTLIELQRKKWLVIRSATIRVLLLASIAVTTAVLWEFHEFLIDYFTGSRIQVNNLDTMKDLFMGTMGGLLSALLVSKKQT